ncbi:MAG: methionine biosynthesis protein MetW [Mycobacteriales bacterium]
MTAAIDCYEQGIRAQATGGDAGWRLRTDAGRTLRPQFTRWCADLFPGDGRLLDGCTGPTIDMGCGPGRLVSALTGRGVPALGVDVAAEAVRQCISRGGSAIQRDFFGRLPGEGRWEHALLADGNVGIGGDPLAVLRRARRLVRPGGRLHVETCAPGTGMRMLSMRFERGRQQSDWFAWALAGADVVCDLAAPTGLRVCAVWTEDGRWFVVLDAT